jgi:hypothetical protein
MSNKLEIDPRRIEIAAQDFVASMKDMYLGIYHVTLI